MLPFNHDNVCGFSDLAEWVSIVDMSCMSGVLQLSWDSSCRATLCAEGSSNFVEGVEYCCGALSLFEPLLMVGGSPRRFLGGRLLDSFFGIIPSSLRGPLTVCTERLDASDA